MERFVLRVGKNSIRLEAEKADNWVESISNLRIKN